MDNMYKREPIPGSDVVLAARWHKWLKVQPRTNDEIAAKAKDMMAEASANTMKRYFEKFVERLIQKL